MSNASETRKGTKCEECGAQLRFRTQVPTETGVVCVPCDSAMREAERERSARRAGLSLFERERCERCEAPNENGDSLCDACHEADGDH